MNSVQFICTKEQITRLPAMDQYKFIPRKGKTCEQDFIAWAQHLAFRFLRWTGALYHPMQESIGYKRYTIDTLKLMEQVYLQREEVFRQGFKPTRLIMGRDDYAALMSSDGVDRYISFNAPIGFNNQIFGLTIEIVPWMRGMVALP